MDKDQELKNSMKGFQALFDATYHPVFGAIYLYEKRTKNVIKLDGLEQEKDVEESECDNELTN